MKLFIKNTFRNLAIAALGAAVLSACGGAGSCVTCSSNSTANTGSLDKLSMVAPSSYPAGVAVTVPIVVTNNGTETINNLNYTIDAASNTTGGTITIKAASAASCRIIAAKASCTLNAEIAATPASHPGSFSVTTSQGADKSGISAFLASSVLSVNVNIGLVQMPTNTSSGADGLTLYYPSAIVGSTNGTTQVIVTAVVTSANSGSFNTIQLIDGNGNPLNYTILSGNSGTGMTNLAYGSVVSFLVTVPSGSSQVQFKAQTAANGTVVSTSANSNTVVVTNPATPTGIMNVSPNYFNLTPNSESQIITLSNSGNGAISSLSFAVTSPLTELSHTCGATLAAGATCQYVVKFNKDIPQAGTSGVTVNYNNGSTSQSATATVNYTGVDPIAGLTITSNNPNFDFISRTNTPSQTALVTLTNSGNTNESGFSFSSVNHFTTNTTGVVNPCSVSTTLTPGASCSVNLVYNNSTAIGVTTDVIPVNYKYGQDALTAHSDIAVTYQTLQSTAILSITPNPTSFIGIVNNNVDNNTQTLSVTNSGDETATLSSTTLSGSNAALFSVAKSSSNPCGASLDANSSCNQDVQFGPTNAAAGSQIASLDINYIPYTSATAITTSAGLTGQVSGAQSAIIAAAQTSMSGFTSGDGTQFNSYQIVQGASAATITYVITNTGNVPANSFYVSGVASSGWSYSGCGDNGVPMTLAANVGSCTLTFTLNTSGVGSRNLDLSTLTMNWVDQDSQSGQTQVMNGMVYANVFIPASITISPNMISVAGGESAIVTVNLSDGYEVADQAISLTDASSTTDGVTITPTQCVVNSTTSSCSFIVQTSVSTPSTNYPLIVGYGSITPNTTTISLSVTSDSLSPSNVVNNTTMTYQTSIAKEISSISTNNVYVTVATNGNFCSGQTISANSSCAFVLSALTLTSVTPVVVTIHYNDGSSSDFNVSASSTNVAAFNTDQIRYVLIRYIWGAGDFDIAAGFQGISPSVFGFPVFTTPATGSCVGYDCRSTSTILYNAQTLVSWAGDNTYGGEEDALVDLWLLPTNTAQFTFGVWGNWYTRLGNPTIMTVTFETYVNGTTFSRGSNRNFVPSSTPTSTASSATDVTWFGGSSSAASLSQQGLVCSYLSPVVSGQANSGSCLFTGN